MLGLESFLNELLDGNKIQIMLVSFAAIILLNLIAKVALEIKKKDLNWDDLPRFIQPIVLYVVFFLGLEVVVVIGSQVDVMRGTFETLQLIGWLSVIVKYFAKFYDNLRGLGFPQLDFLESFLRDRLKEKIENLNE